MDNILIYLDRSLQDHRVYVEKVLKRLYNAGLQLDIDKCKFKVQNTRHLGFIIEAEQGICMDPAEVSAILEWQVPTTVKGVRGFLGFANFYQKFINGFLEYIWPLSELTHKDQTF